MTEDSKREKQPSGNHKPVEDNIENSSQAAGDHDDEFVSDLHQASSKDIAEADEAMKKLGLTKVCFSFLIASLLYFASLHYFTCFVSSRTILNGKPNWREN